MLFQYFTAYWTDWIISKNFKYLEIAQFIATALKTIPKLVEMQSLGAKCCKDVTLLSTANSPVEKRLSILRCLILKYTKFANFTGVYFSHFTTFPNQTLHFYTNFGMLFNAVVMNCTISNFLKILSIMQSVHYWNYCEKSRSLSTISDEWWV